MAHEPTATRSWILGEFTDAHALVDACRKMREAGHQDIDTYSPYPLHGIDEALAWKPSRIPYIALAGALVGGFGAYAMEYGLNGVLYPINVANRLLNATPAYIPITFEATILCTGLFIFYGLLGLLGFPRHYHPVFESEAFVRTATTSAYWISVTVPTSDKDGEIADNLKSLGARTVDVVKEEV